MSEFTKDTYLLQESFTEATIDVLIEEGYKAYDRFAEAYLNYKNEKTKPGFFNVYGGSYTMKNSEVPVEIGATNMTISSALYEGGFVEANTKFELTTTNFINNGTISIIDESEDTYSVTFKSNAEFVNNSSVTVSNAIFDVATVSNAANATFALTDGAVFTAASVTNSGSFSLDNAAFTASTVNNNAGATFNLTNDASIELAAVTNDGTFNIVKGNVAGKFSGTGTIEINTNTLEANTIDISGTGTVNLKGIASSKYVKLGSAKIEAATISSTKRVDLDGATLKATTATLADMRLSGTNTFDFGSLTAGTLYMMANSQIKGSKIGSESGTKATIQSWSSNPTVSISGENDLYATITNKGTLNIAAAGKIYTASIVNSGADSKIISNGANVVLGSEEKRVSLSNTKGLIGLEHNATVVASSISGDSGATYEITDSSVTAESLSLTSSCAFVVEGASSLNIGTVSGNSTITLQNATISASSISGGKVSIPKQYDTGNGTPEEPVMADNTVTFSGVNSILSTITNNGAIIVNDTLTAGAVTNNGAITVNGTLTAGAVTNNSGSSLTLAKNATLNASSLTVDGGSLSLGAGSTVDLGEEGDLISSVGLTITSATVIADEITAEGKDLTFVSSNITADTITAGSVVFRTATTLNIGTITEGTTVTIRSKQEAAGTRAMVTDSSVGTGSVTTMYLAGFSGTNNFDVINNTGNLTVAGSLTANSIDSSANGASFKVTAAGTQLNTKFTGTIDFADGATLGDSTFKEGSAITVNKAAFIDADATVTLTVGNGTKLTNATDPATSLSGTINLVAGENYGELGDYYQLIDGNVDNVTLTVNGESATSITLGEGSDAKTYGLITLSTGLYLAENQTQETLYVSSDYAGKAAGTKINGHIVGYNAFGKLTEALAQDVANEIIVDNASVEAATADLLYGVPLTKSVTVKPKANTSQTVTITLTGGNSADLCLTPIGADTVLTIEEGITLDLTTSTNKGKVWFVYNWEEKPRATDLGPLGSIVFKGSIINTNTTSSADAGSQFNGNVTLTETATIKQTNKNISFRSGASGNVNAVVTITGAGNDSAKTQIDVGTGTLEFTSGNVVTSNTYIKGGKFQLSDAHWQSDCALSVDSTNTTWNITGGIYSTGNGSSGFKDTITLKVGSLLQVATATIGGLVTMDLQDSDMNVLGAMTNSGKITLGTASQDEQLLSSTLTAEPEYTSELNVRGDLTNKASIEAKDGSFVSVTGTLTNSGKILVLEVPMRRATSNGSNRTVTVTLKKGTEVVGSATATVYDHRITGWAPADVAHRVTTGGDTVFAVFDFGDQAIADGEYDVVVEDPGFTGDVATAPDGTLINTSSFTDGFKYAAKATVANASIDLTSSTLLTADSIVNAGTITVTDSTLNATVVDTSAVGAEFTVGGASTLNISGTGSSLTGTITLADGANVKATIAKGGTLNVAAETAATLAAGSSVASAITNAGTLTLGSDSDSVTKTGKITNDGTVSGYASTVGGIANNAGSVTLKGKSFSSVTVKKGTVSLTAENADTGIAVGSITNGTKGTKTAEAINGNFIANHKVTGSGAITNYAGRINVTGNLTLTPNSKTGVRPAITNGSIYTSGTTVRVGVGSIEVTGALTAGDITNGVENGATVPADKSSITAASITADSITNYGTIGSQTQGKPHITTLTLEQREVTVGGEPATTTGALINKKYGEVFAGTLNAASIENEGGIDVGAIDITSEAGTFVNEAGAKAVVGVSVSAYEITNNGYLQAGDEGTIMATDLTNGAYVAAETDEGTADGFINAGSIVATGNIDNAGQVTVSGNISGASISNAGSIEAGSIDADTIVNGIAATTDPEAPAVEGTITAGSIEADGDITNNAGEIIVSGKISGASISNAGSIDAGSIEGDIVNTGSITATNVSAATVSTNGASFTVDGTSTLNIKKLTGTITLDNGATVTAMVKGGTLDVENGSTVSLVGAEGNTAAVTNLGDLTIAGGVIGTVTNKQVVVDKDTVKGTLTVESDEAIQTGAFTNNAIVNVNSAFTVKGNFNNQAGATITIDATKFDFTESDTVCAISVTGTLTNAGEISVTGGAPGEYDLIVKNDGADKGVYLYKNSDPLHPVDMSYLLVYSDLASQYNPGESFPFAGHEYVYALSAFATATAMTKIGEDTEEIDFVTQSGTYGNLNLTLFADQEIDVNVVNGTGKKVSADLNFNNLSIAASEAGEDEDVGAITFNNDVVTGAEVANTTVAISTATVDFQGANFSASKSVTIKDDAHVTFSDDFSAAAATITGSEVDFAGVAAFAGNAAITAGSEVYFLDEANFAGTANISGSEVYFDDANFAGNATISGSTVAFDGAATFSNGETEGVVNATISGSTVDFAGAATVEGLLKLTGSEVTAEAAITASSTNLDKNSTLNLSTGDANLGDLTTAAGSKINLTYQSKLSFTATAVQGNFDIDVTGLTSTKNTAPATITGIPSVTKVSIVGNNTENNVAKYFNYDTENKTLTLINKACNEIKVNSKSSLDNALKYTWEGDDGETYYADNVIVQDVTYADALYFVNAARTAHVNQYITIEGGEFQKSVFGGKKQETAGTGRFDVVDLGGNLNLTIEDGHFTKTVVAGDNIKVKGLFYREGTITTTISGGTFEYNFAGGLLYNLTDVTSQAIVTGTSLTINSETADTIFNETVYGGNFSAKKAGSNCTFIDEKAIVRIEAGEENTIKMKALIVGSYGNGVIEKGTELTLTGNGDNLEIESVWGGCGSDYYTEDAKREYVTTMAANATRTLTFEGFKNTFNCTSIRGFSDVIVKSETDVTLINTDKYGLADASNWTFEFGSSLNGAFANNFAGDDLTLTGIEAMTEGGDPWVICDKLNFETFAFEGIKSINGVTGDDLVFADNAYTFGAGDNQYKLSFGDYNVGESEETSSAMYLTRLA